MTRITQQRRRAQTLRRALLAFVAAVAVGALAAAAPAAPTGPQPAEEWDGTAPAPDLGLTGSADVRQFTVLSGYDNDLVTVTVTWDPGPAVAYDLDLYVDQLDASGNWIEVDHSTNGQLLGGAAEEVVEFAAPTPGTYRTRVVNWASTTVAYHGSIVYSSLERESGGGSGGPSARIVTTGWVSPVKVTPDGGFGYEPTLVVDRFGNAFATAHKENWQLLLAPDPNSPDHVRSMSWMWMSADRGQTWTNPPGLTALNLEDQEVGDEGDLALDDASHLYFVDTSLADVSLTRWTLRGLNDLSLDFTRPVLPSSGVDDRPWVVAHGDGHVFYFGNDGGKEGDGGRYTEYSSYDGGTIFDSVGQVLPDSGWCRPAADHRPGSQLLYVACTNDEGTLYSYVSTDDGQTWQRYVMGSYNNEDDTQSWPTVEVAPDGTVWALYVDSNDVTGGIPNTNRLILFRSTDQGQTWTSQDVTPVTGRYQYAWLSVSPDGRKLGLGVYYRPTSADPWKAYGATWAAGGRIRTFVSVDDGNPVASADRAEPPGDYMNSAFFPDGKLGIVWTRIVLTTDVATLERDIYFSRQN